MKGTLLVCALLMLTLSQAQSFSVVTFTEKWENSKNYLLEIAQSMPEENYDYKPTEREMSFKEQLIHIQQNMNWLGKTYFNAEIEENPEKLTKQKLIEVIAQSFDAVKIAVLKTSEEELHKKVDFFAGEKTKLQILNLLQDHVTHHRGQIIVYLNLNHIKPPKYVGW
ncbi:DinB family protein [Galbibacter mesophilus]|uniref:DinB family protein n=1 Tax=Galbibacter mesophilus TaxID=379069 RepID=UPI00191F9FAD|nr:DinB family protein [Galbibacter mesophilus]MCM5662368.1 DinB family protein [Galbibacter mesophilus]